MVVVVVVDRLIDREWGSTTVWYDTAVVQCIKIAFAKTGAEDGGPLIMLFDRSLVRWLSGEQESMKRM